jgi:glycerol kinase
MSEVILGLDQGTSSTRCFVFDRRLEAIGAASVPVACSFPAAGLVEQDPAELVGSARAAIDGALADAEVSFGEVAGVGIANQTETFVVCDRVSGRPIHPAIVWQDRRTTERCAALSAAGEADAVRALTGLELDATFPATKIAWLLDHVGGARAAAEAGEFAYHDVGSWLVRDLCGLEVCEASNAGRTLLCRLGGEDWDDGLLELFGVPRALLPPIIDSDGLGSGGTLPVRAMLGDQQASLFGLGCHEPGMAKVTLGTGAFVLAQGGAVACVPPRGVLGSCAWRRNGQTSFALEGFIPTAGAALSWFSEIGVLPDARELEALIEVAGPEEPELMCVPALQGLGTPSWDAAARGTLLGLSRGTTRAQLARAVVDGILHQVADALEAITTRVSIGEVLVDGGLSRSTWIVQRLADICGVRVRRTLHTETTAVGAAMLAGLATGFWSDLDQFPAVTTDLLAEPSLPAAERTRWRELWRSAIELTTAW